MESRGARLKKIRLEKGVSIEEAHKKTKIHKNILKAIEDDALVNLSPVYIKGFLKIYCKFLGIDPSDFIKDYKDPSYNRPQVKQAGEAKEIKIKPFLRTMSLKFNAFKPHLTSKTAAVFICIIIIVFLAFKLPKIISYARKNFVSKTSSSAVLTEKKSKDAPQAVVTQKTQSQTAIRLAIRVKDNCLVKVKVDGRLVMDRVFRKGMSDSWTAKEKIELSLGNAGVADLEINGKQILPLGRKGQAIKNIVITKDGWSIPR